MKQKSTSSSTPSLGCSAGDCRLPLAILITNKQDEQSELLPEAHTPPPAVGRYTVDTLTACYNNINSLGGAPTVWTSNLAVLSVEQCPHCHFSLSRKQTWHINHLTDKNRTCSHLLLASWISVRAFVLTLQRSWFLIVPMDPELF